MTRALCVPLPYSATPYTGRETPGKLALPFGAFWPADAEYLARTTLTHSNPQMA